MSQAVAFVLVAALVQQMAVAQPPEGFESCVKNTGGSCNWLDCDQSRGPTDCLHGKCKCKAGYCAINGVCTNSCSHETGGTCRIFSCKAERGPTDCVHGKCLCKAGYCQIDGTCKPSCVSDIGSSCENAACPHSHGRVQCVDGRCVCPEGFCAEAGRCEAPEPVGLLATWGNATRTRARDFADELSEPEIDWAAVSALVAVFVAPVSLASIVICLREGNVRALGEPLLEA
mmetsp:Transcript_7561/g.16447  ORF Transcript_7561/g.16447 Transcript_7561/m.16447 type:complete len:230 (-) Transcript_7561:96-785(-)|eukprot:CAMPEP_0170598806 /NCGR_PEP_ID=MMETSP0224-20130122/16447_1 /TAXON_ID=285029 /ORGANISM="Togula jolla, Strain CCCM 725" /LENGTH=229 /DNA_ID=CAMNT_0010923389 /DNA_START=62 /DNA_END=751 /DNA_ORIENTATION=-